MPSLWYILYSVVLSKCQLSPEVWTPRLSCRPGTETPGIVTICDVALWSVHCVAMLISACAHSTFSCTVQVFVSPEVWTPRLLSPGDWNPRYCHLSDDVALYIVHWYEHSVTFAVLWILIFYLVRCTSQVFVRPRSEPPGYFITKCDVALCYVLCHTSDSACVHFEFYTLIVTSVIHKYMWSSFGAYL